MLPKKRQIEIKKYLTEKGFATVEDLSKIFKVSEMTIRRDLDELDTLGLIQRVYGGAISSDADFYEMWVSAKISHFLAEKESIAKEAAKLVLDGDTILIDSGTTTSTVAKYIKNKKITLITNVLNVALELTSVQNINIIVAGGILETNTIHTLGPQTISFIKDLHVDKAFIGVEGVHPINGISVPEIHESYTKEVMISIADKAIVLADHHKLGRDTTAKIADISDIDILITDSKANKEVVEALRENIEVIIAD